MKKIAVKMGDRIDQSLLFPYIKDKAVPMERTGGFGSTGRQFFFFMLLSLLVFCFICLFGNCYK